MPTTGWSSGFAERAERTERATPSHWPRSSTARGGAATGCGRASAGSRAGCSFTRRNLRRRNGGRARQ